MPRVASNKSYGRDNKESFASRAFDAVMLGGGTKANKAASTIKKWGATSFTSTRGTPTNIEQPEQLGSTSRKRKLEAPEPDACMFDDPFSFDSDDDGPKKPKRGMGYKKDEATAKPGKTPGSKVLERDENNEEKDSITNAPSRTYSKSLKIQKLDNGTAKKNTKQLSLEGFFGKKQHTAPSTQVSNVPRKFFLSRQGGSSSSLNTSDSSGSKSDKSKGKPPTSSLSFFESDEEEEDKEVPGSSQNDGPGSSQRDGPGSSQRDVPGPSQRDTSLTSRTDSPIVISGDNDDNDTDSVSSQQLEDGNNRKKQSLKLKLCSQSSVASNGSTSSICDSLKWDNRPVMKISSLDRDAKDSASSKPLVRRLLTSPKKTSRLVKKASYNPRQWHDSDDDIGSSQDPSTQNSQKQSSSSGFDFDDEPVKPAKDAHIRKKVQQPARPGFDKPVTKLNIDKEHKPLYTVVKHVKEAHEVLESGETQEFQDDIDYIMDGLGDTQNTAIRCQSAMNLTSKCVSSAFRMHLRAHGILNTIFGKLHDAYKYPKLALATSSLMFFVSRDRFSMDLECATLELMVKLLDGDGDGGEEDDAELTRMQARIQDTCQHLQNEGRKFDIHIDEVSSGLLAMETLLSLTSKRAGEWFKEELRTLGGLDHIINTVSECVGELDEFVIDPTDAMLERLKKIDRCLRVLENVTYNNPDNQSHLVTYRNCLVLKDLCHTLRVCENCMPFNLVEMEKGKVKKDCAGYTIFTCLLSVLRVLLNITHDNPHGSTKAGQQDLLLKTVLIIVLRVPQYIPAEERFDLLVLGVGLLINLVEHCDHNRELLIDTHAVQPYDEHATVSKVSSPMESLEALAKLFLIRYEAARRIEEEHDAKLEEKEAAKKEQRTKNASAHNKSGEWKESGAGLEWVAGKDASRDGFGFGDDEEEENAFPPDPKAAAATDEHDSDGEEATDFSEALHKAGKHMEGCILAAYAGLLIGCTIQGNSEHIERVRNCLPDGNFEPMVRMLRKFLGFMNFTSCTSGSGSKSISHIIEVLEAC